MDSRQLHRLFNPVSIAVIGASSQPGSVGYAVLNNLRIAGFAGPVYPINPQHRTVQDLPAYAGISDLPQRADLAVICTPADTVPGILEQCAGSGVLSAVVISAGFSESGESGRKLVERIERIVAANHMALLGPNCLGFIRPKLRLNASFSRKTPLKGGIAFISQSGALGAAVLDWSVSAHVGFSYFVSVGDMVDIGFHDLIDYFGNDPETRAILIYMETLSQARRFMSAARGFARTKPIIVLKVGRSQEGARAALFHTGSITGNNQVFDAAFRRAGILRVDTIAELFDCAKTLAMQKRPSGNRLAIVTNAGGPGVIATDSLVDQGGVLAELSESTLHHLEQKLPRFSSRGNPVDILGDAGPERFSLAVKACLEDGAVDGVLAILTPQAMTDAPAVARQLVGSARNSYKTVLAAFMGADDVTAARSLLEAGGIPAYETPEEAVRSFLNMVEYQRNLKLLAETPATIPHAFKPETALNRRIICSTAASGRFVLTWPETRQVLANYHIPVAQAEMAADPAQARLAAARLGYPVVMKVVSPDILYEKEVGAVAPRIRSAPEIEPAYDRIVRNALSRVPHARIFGVHVEKLVEKRHELIIGCKKDPIFGPVIVFGMGGVAVDVFRDTNIGIPPLNMSLAAQLIDGTRIATLLRGYRGTPAVDVSAIQFLLYKFAYLVMDFPEIGEMDLDPFAVDEHGGIVLDAKIILDEDLAGKSPVRPYSHMVISPYPAEYECTVQLADGRSVLLRPIRPEDEPLEAELFKTFSPETMRFRFFAPVKEATHETLIPFTQIDYDREIAIIAELVEAGVRKMVGVVRLIADPYNETAEYAIVVGDPWAGRGLGTILTSYILEIAQKRGIHKVVAFLLRDNASMRHIFQKFGFSFRAEEDVFHVELPLDAIAAP